MLIDLLLIALVVLAWGGVIMLDEKLGERRRQGTGERCPVCGYLVDGPLHNSKCESQRKVRQMSDSDIKTRQLFRINRDKLGF